MNGFAQYPLLCALALIKAASADYLVENLCCSGLPGGNGFRSLNNCGDYYNCLDGVAQVHTISSCSGDLLFNDAAGYCDYAASFTCDTTKCGVPSAPPPCPDGQLCCPPYFTGKLGTNQCGSFYTCVAGVLVSSTTTACPSGTLFDKAKQRCEVTDQDFKCELYVGGSDGFKDDTGSSSGSNGGGGRCCPDGLTGGWPDQGCATYYVCEGGGKSFWRFGMMQFGRICLILTIRPTCWSLSRLWSRVEYLWTRSFVRYRERIL